MMAEFGLTSKVEKNTPIFESDCEKSEISPVGKRFKVERDEGRWEEYLKDTQKYAHNRRV